MPTVQIWERIGTDFTLWARLAGLAGLPTCLPACVLASLLTCLPALLAARLAPPRPEPSGVPRKQWEIDGGA